MSFPSLSIAALLLCAIGANLFAQEDRRPEDESLLETIKIEAANMEVFPVDLIATERLGAIYRKQGVLHWGDRYDLTFERYEPFYRFKTRAGLATPDELDACVDAFDQMSPREKALVITAIFIFERTRRRPLENEERLTPNGNLSQRFPYYPFYPVSFLYYYPEDLVLPRYAPTDSIAKEKWNEWISVIERSRTISDEAFPAFKPDQWNPSFDRVFNEKHSSNESVFESWKQNLEACRALVENKLNISDAHFGLDAFAFQKGRTFLKKVYELELDPSRSKFEQEFALRDYYFAIQRNDRFMHSGSGPKSGNSSFVPKTLGDIADQLLKSRLEYEPSEPIQTP